MLESLIHSLSQTEKRYFKRWCQLQTDKNATDYLILFELYEEGLSEKEVKLKFSSKHFPQKKRHLYLKLLESLQAYYKGVSQEESLLRDLRNVEILLDHQVIGQAIKEYKKIQFGFEKHENKTLFNLNKRIGIRIALFFEPNIDVFSSTSENEMLKMYQMLVRDKSALKSTTFDSLKLIPRSSVSESFKTFESRLEAFHFFISKKYAKAHTQFNNELSLLLKEQEFKDERILSCIILHALSAYLSKKVDKDTDYNKIIAKINSHSSLFHELKLEAETIANCLTYLNKNNPLAAHILIKNAGLYMSSLKFNNYHGLFPLNDLFYISLQLTILIKGNKTEEIIGFDRWVKKVFCLKKHASIRNYSKFGVFCVLIHQQQFEKAKRESERLLSDLKRNTLFDKPSWMESIVHLYHENNFLKASVTKTELISIVPKKPDYQTLGIENACIQLLITSNEKPTQGT